MENPEEHSDTVQQELAALPSIGVPSEIRFLARGEYTLNYLVVFDEQQAVARLVTGSQMNLSVNDQVRYEAHALELLSLSERTPRLLGVKLEPEWLPFPWMLIEFLPGRPLDYQRDLVAAARCVAEIHRLVVPGDHRLVDQSDPRAAIRREAAGLAQPYLDWRGPASVEAGTLADFAERASAALGTYAAAFENPDLAIVNTDLNTHNFVVDTGGRASLLDWEKARIGPTALDLAHFLLPTTTLWRDDSAHHLSRDDERRFLDTYLEERPDLDRDRYLAQLQVMKALAAWRAIAWCAWALQASESGEKAISNPETLAKCRLFTTPEFLERLRGELGM